MLKKGLYIGASIIGISALSYFLWSFLFTTNPEITQNTGGDNLGVSDIRAIVGTTGNTPIGQEGSNTITGVPTQPSNQKIFKISDGPISSASFVEIKNPTTTLARYILAHNGHVQDLAIDVPGSIAKSVSNTTIPGVMRSLMVVRGSTAILQYIDSATIKTVSLTFPAASTSTSAAPVRLQFFPDGITDIALSPDGTQAAYVLRATKGVDGYVSKSDGSGSKKMFSVPLSQLSLTWPSAKTLLIQTTYHSESPGIVFIVDPTNGNVVPTLYGNGLSVAANTIYSHLAYQIVGGASSLRSTYVRDIQNGTDSRLSFNPFPEKCIWSVASSTHMYCAVPSIPAQASYYDLWHMGTASRSDSIVVFDVSTGESNIIAAPGGNQGGMGSDIVHMAISPNNKYLLFIKKGDRSLWGVRLAQ